MILIKWLRVRLRVALVLLMLAQLCVSSTEGQSGRRHEVAGADESEEVLRVRTEEVLLPVSVRDATGAPVNGLVPDSFFIYDNGVRQQINSFNRERIPANIVILLDASGSVFSKMRFIREAAKGFIEGLRGEDKVCVMQFADKAELLQDWTSAATPAPLLKAIDWRYHAGESTVFYDALYLAAEEQLKKVEGRRLIILLTDGIDTGERLRASFADAQAAVRRAEATVYVVSLTASLRALLRERTGGKLGRILASGYDPRQVARYMSLIENAEKLLTGLAEQTGGRIFLPVKEEELAPAYSAIAEELRTQYIITYQPRPRAQAGTWRPVRVLVSPGTYEVASRKGYTVPR
ncbi:MAG TPA: VWA domain-containing protein [Pyrinomonadaceae bacterium]|nr:VWA domain-containing protein [Pyrinomonadaceae bacterium]